MAELTIVVATSLEIPRSIRGNQGRVCVRISGVGQSKMRSFAERLNPEQSGLILHVGFCGGVGDEVKTGDIIVASSVCYRGEILSVSTERVAKILETLRGNNVRIIVGKMETFDKPVTTRRDISRDTLGVDMESFALAHVLTSRQIPFCIVKVVSDLVPSYTPIPFRHVRLAYQIVTNLRQAKSGLDTFIRQFMHQI